MKRYVAAIDLGTTKVVSLVGEKTESGYKIVAFKEAPSKGVMRGEVVNIQNVLDSLIPTIREIKQEDGIEISEVYVGIAGQNIKCNTSRHSRNRGKSDELISDREIEEMEQEIFNSRVSAGEKILHVMPQSYNVDDHIGVKDPVGMTGTQIDGDYKIFIGKINSVEHSKLVINRAGLVLKEFILEPVASATAVLSEDEMELGVAMVDMGGGTTDLLIYEDNIIRHTSVIPFGGNSITEDLSQGCGVSSRNAEQMKIQYGSCYSEYAPENKTVIIPGIGGRESREVSFKVIASIIEARVEEIIEAVMYEIENSGYQDKLRAGIVITGGASQLTNLCQFVKYKTGYDTRIASPNNSITFDSCEGVCKPSSSTAVGLIIKGFESEKSAKEVAGQGQLVATLFPKEQITEIESEAPHKTKTEKREKRHGSFLDQTLGVLGGIFDNSDNEA